MLPSLDANYGLFTSTPDGLAYPNPAAERLDGGLALLEFMGLMFGKALYEGILLPVPFAHFFVSRLQGRQPLFDDLATLDPELHKNLLMVKRYEGEVADLGLTFSAETDFFGSAVHHELLPGRGDEPVTNDSRLLYCHLLADWHLNGKLGPPATAFARGLFNLIPQASLRLFNPREFNQLLSGAAAEGPGGGGAAALDVSDMRRWARYSGGYKHDSTTIKLFWAVIKELTPPQQAALLRFVTSCSRPPLGGFQYLQPPLTLHKVDCDAGLFAAIGGRDVDRLPSASTCYNMLKLPNYRRAATLKAKLLYSITSGAGFELS
ncbi:E3 ubiquitin-protein ligase [Tetrabaena socialis]|uniref:HECT-type E3 ubiquitin transferase n=2 Tax=Tetrabaena socialis TaxID=47790 RepID=A0A2J8AFE4_9CHLO|nr:E3 ubiquitin-protein ligase [Tetrabaena socialis]|eukprot:PNH11212.1 E3 ubiquitin-protein ligase [Tetrabaena socialis]